MHSLPKILCNVCFKWKAVFYQPAFSHLNKVVPNANCVFVVSLGNVPASKWQEPFEQPQLTDTQYNSGPELWPASEVLLSLIQPHPEAKEPFIYSEFYPWKLQRHAGSLEGAWMFCTKPITQTISHPEASRLDFTWKNNCLPAPPILFRASCSYASIKGI